MMPTEDIEVEVGDKVKQTGRHRTAGQTGRPGNRKSHTVFGCCAEYLRLYLYNFIIVYSTESPSSVQIPIRMIIRLRFWISFIFGVDRKITRRS